ncbi:MAG: ribonuclease Z [Pyrinomonadaceae bacterium]
MQITFLGTSAGVPTKLRNVSSVALRLQQRGEVWLFDCGEGTQQQIMRSSDVKLSQVTRIFITHMHGDHSYGLMGLLASAGMSASAERIDVYGPQGIEDYVKACCERSYFRPAYKLEVHAVEAGVIFEDEEYFVSCEWLKHSVPDLGFRVTEKDRPGRFDVEKAQAMGIPSGPIFGQLKRGEDVTLPDGRKVSGAEFCGPLEKGRSVVYCTDTTYCQSSVKLAREADVLIHEATFVNEDEDVASYSLHSTAAMAAEVARAAEVKRLIITHFSPRYAVGNPFEPDVLLTQARAIFPQTLMAQDFLTVDVPRNLAT